VNDLQSSLILHERISIHTGVYDGRNFSPARILKYCEWHNLSLRWSYCLRGNLLKEVLVRSILSNRDNIPYMMPVLLLKPHNVYDLGK
jgi:hypothetical protein